MSKCLFCLHLSTFVRKNANETLFLSAFICGKNPRTGSAFASRLMLSVCFLPKNDEHLLISNCSIQDKSPMLKQNLFCCQNRWFIVEVWPTAVELFMFFCPYRFGPKCLQSKYFLADFNIWLCRDRETLNKSRMICGGILRKQTTKVYCPFNCL